jgi:glutathione S-transferase
MTDRVTLYGAPGSPYTRKMLAVLRYRRIPYRFLTGKEAASLPQPKVRLLPTFYFPDEAGNLQPTTDSSPIIRRLERTFPDRRVIPADPALAFLDHLVEDYADEWLTKAMFHYRWAYEADARKAARVLPNWMGGALDDDALAGLSQAFGDRQKGRLSYVGSNSLTGPVIEASYRRLLGVLEGHLSSTPFLFGDRPGSADFALFGQLTQLVDFDPTPTAIAEDIAPRVIAWTGRIEDLSGLEATGEGWLSFEDAATRLAPLLAEIGRVYAPLLLANADALSRGEAEVSTVIDGAAWRQNPFPYQAKCLLWLREARAALSGADQARVDAALAGTGCQTLFCAP